MLEPLNMPLFRVLQGFSGGVRISNEGQPRQVRYEPRSDNPQRLRGIPVAHGEQYRVNCPFCGDTKHRLNVSYQYGEYDDVLKQTNYSLWFCQNEQCHKLRVNRDRFRDLAAIPIGRAVRRRRAAQPANPAPPIIPPPIQLPDSEPVDQLPADYDVVLYLKQRGFDPGELARVWDVRYVPYVRGWSQHPAQHRLLAPIVSVCPRLTEQDRPAPYLVGWQARRLRDDENSPKYLFATGFAKSKHLYGVPQALQVTGPIVLVEGVTDVWRAGPGAVATFGKHISKDQKSLLQLQFAGRPIVILPDADAVDSARMHAAEFRLASGFGGVGPVMVGSLPPHRSDPGECTREEIWAAVETAISTRQNNSH